MINKLNFREHWPVGLVFMAIFAQPFGVSFELFTLIMSISAVRLLWMRPEELSWKAVRLYTLLFVSVWIPGWISLIDAEVLKRGVITQLGYLRFYLAGVFVIWALSSEEKQNRFALSLSLLVGFWLVDAWVQVVTGSNLFGMVPDEPGRISGIFGSNQVFGWILLLYGTVVVSLLIKHKYFWLLSILVPLLVATVFVSGNRGAWIGLGWMGLVLCWTLYRWHLKIRVLPAFLTLILSVGLVFSLLQHERVQDRLEHSLQGMGSSYSEWDLATSYRLSLWATTSRMISDNLLNGVGVKNFRYAYPDYAGNPDPFLAMDGKGRTTGAYHAHQIILEVLSESGVLGLVGLLAFFTILIKLFSELIQSREWLSIGYFCGLVGVLFPLNSHLSLFASYWAQAVWLLVALTVSSWAVFRKSV